HQELAAFLLLHDYPTRRSSHLPYTSLFRSDYVHRIGRTGRAGASGEALSLVSLDEVGYLKDIEKLIGERLEAKTLPDFKPTETMADVKAAEEEKKQQKAQRHSRGRNAGTKVNTHAKSNTNKSNRGKGRR